MGLPFKERLVSFDELRMAHLWLSTYVRCTIEPTVEATIIAHSGICGIPQNLLMDIIVHILNANHLAWRYIWQLTLKKVTATAPSATDPSSLIPEPGIGQNGTVVLGRSWARRQMEPRIRV
jgi:hypothetical protein